MANSYIGTKHPKGNVGVRQVVDAADLSVFSQGVLSGFGASGATSWTLSVGGVSGVQDVAVGKNPGGESDLFVGTAGQEIDFIIGGAPGTPGQSRTDALVIYKDPFATSAVNDGIDAVDYQVVAGTAATTGSQVPPDDTDIRAAIPSGSLKFVAVIGYVTIAYGASGVTTGNYVQSRAVIDKQTVATVAELDAIVSPTEGMEIYCLADDAKYVYDGTAWLAFDSKWQTYTPTLTNLTIGNRTRTCKYFRTGKKCTVRVHLLFGSTTSMGTDPRVALPFTGAAIPGTGNILVEGVLSVYDVSATGIYYGHFGNATTTGASMRVTATNGTYAAVQVMASATPFTWATGDEIGGEFTYDMA